LGIAVRLAGASTTAQPSAPERAVATRDDHDAALKIGHHSRV